MHLRITIAEDHIKSLAGEVSVKYTCISIKVATDCMLYYDWLRKLPKGHLVYFMNKGPYSQIRIA